MGTALGLAVGVIVGPAVGLTVGTSVGMVVGLLGMIVGFAVGRLGMAVGDLVGPPGYSHAQYGVLVIPMSFHVPPPAAMFVWSSLPELLGSPLPQFVYCAPQPSNQTNVPSNTSSLRPTHVVDRALAAMKLF